MMSKGRCSRCPPSDRALASSRRKDVPSSSSPLAADTASPDAVKSDVDQAPEVGAEAEISVSSEPPCDSQSMLRAWAVVPAAGSGERFGDDCPKQFNLIQGHTLISYTVSSLLMCDEVRKVIVVISDRSKVGRLPLGWRSGMQDDSTLDGGSDHLHTAQHHSWEPRIETAKITVCKENETTPPSPERRVMCVTGSTSRHRSIKCGLDAMEQLLQNGSVRAPDVVLVHDGVRPLVPPGLVSRLVAAAAADGAAGVTRPLVSTVLETPPGRRGRLQRSLDRSRHRASETPQAFRYSVIRRAYQQCSERELDHGTECLQLALTHAGVAARLLEGPPDLWKVTYRHDLHAFRGVLDDTRVRLAVVSEAASLEDTRDELVRLLSPRLPRSAAVPASELTNASCSYSCLVLLRPMPTSQTGTEVLETALSLDRRLHGYVVDVRVGQVEEGLLTKPDAAEMDEFLQRTGKWLCRVDCAEEPADGGRRLAALLTAVLLSEEGAFHGQVLRV